MNNVHIKQGKMIRTWGGWYRHDEVYINGEKLEGTIQVRRKPKRPIDVLTGYKGMGVPGRAIEWLAKMNGYVGMPPGNYVKSENSQAPLSTENDNA
jgi:hypothetical protein